MAFMGALFIIKPTGNMADPAALMSECWEVREPVQPIALCACAGKKRGEWKAGESCAFLSLYLCVLRLPFLIGHFAPMEWWQVAAMIAAGFGGAGGQIFVTKAYFYAPAKEISVFDYSQIMFSALMGFLVLGQKPDMLQSSADM